MKHIVLASSSPRRRELLERIGLPFTVEPSNYQEDMALPLKPDELVKCLSLEKAKAVAQKHTNALIIGADTIVVHRGKIFGKPQNSEDARAMLKELQGTAHYVVSGFSIIDSESGESLSKFLATKIYMKKLTEEEIREYIATGEPFDRAGAYTVEGKGAVFIKKIEGDYFNVVGLSLFALSEALTTFNVSVIAIAKL